MGVAIPKIPSITAIKKVESVNNFNLPFNNILAKSIKFDNRKTKKLTKFCQYNKTCFKYRFDNMRESIYTFLKR